MLLDHVRRQGGQAGAEPPVRLLERDHVGVEVAKGLGHEIEAPLEMAVLPGPARERAAVEDVQRHEAGGGARRLVGEGSGRDGRQQRRGEQGVSQGREASIGVRSWSPAFEVAPRPAQARPAPRRACHPVSLATTRQEGKGLPPMPDA